MIYDIDKTARSGDQFARHIGNSCEKALNSLENMNVAAWTKKLRERYASLPSADILKEAAELEASYEAAIELKEFIENNHTQWCADLFSIIEALQTRLRTALGPLTTHAKVTSAGTHIHYHCIGEGFPILHLSGGPGFSSEYLMPVASVLSSPCGSRIARWQRRQYRSIMVDLRGTGQSKLSDAEKGKISVPDLLKDIEAIRVELGIEQWAVLGHSWGGHLAMHYAAEYGNVVSALILVSTPAPGTDLKKVFSSTIHSRLHPLAHEIACYWGSGFRVKDNYPKAVIEKFKAVFPAYMFDRSEVLSFTREMSEGSFNPLVFTALVDSILKDDQIEKLSHFRNPALIIQGRQDPLDVSSAYDIVNMFRHRNNKEIRALNECGHFPWVESRWLFSSLLLLFLEKHLPVGRKNRKGSRESSRK